MPSLGDEVIFIERIILCGDEVESLDTAQEERIDW
jgi:hypothetical protein